jgi:membrane protease YdiL (CAAX protease family)
MRIIPVRLLVLFVLFFALYVGCQALPGLIFHVVKNTPERGLFDLESAAFLAVVMIVAYWLAVRLVEGRSAKELGTKDSFLGLAGGVLLGMLLFSSVYGLLWLMGYAHVTGWTASSGVETALAIAIASAVGEEIVMRGIFFRIFEQGFGTIAAIVVSSLLFGLLHALNQGATPWSTAAIALEAGALLGASYAATRTLWVPIGLHFGWNFAEGGIFGAAVSGREYHGLIANTISGPSIWTGGVFGPEASIAAVAIGLVAASVLLVLANGRGQWKPLQLRWQIA